MKTLARHFGRIAIVAFTGALVFSTAANASEALSSPAEQMATAKLNSTITAKNAASDDRFKVLEAQYQQEKMQNDDLLAQYQAQNTALQQQYEDLRKNYTALDARYLDEKKQNDDLQQQYQELSKHSH